MIYIPLHSDEYKGVLKFIKFYIHYMTLAPVNVCNLYNLQIYSSAIPWEDRMMH